MRWRISILLTTIAATGLIAIGCGEDDVVEPLRESIVKWPASEDSLMALFSEAYSNMDIDAYRDILHEDYQFKFQQHDIDNLGLLSDHLDCDGEMGVATNMFSGTAMGYGIPGISNINWGLLEPQGIWDTSYHPEFPNARRRIYNIALRVERASVSTIEITGQQDFYVTSHDSVMQDGSIRPYFQVVGQVDMSDISTAKSSEVETWGGLKVLFK